MSEIDAIIDTFNEEKSCSRQYEWALKMIAEGRCSLCGKPRNKYAKHCDDCRKESSRLEAERRQARQHDRELRHKNFRELRDRLRNMRCVAKAAKRDCIAAYCKERLSRSLAQGIDGHLAKQSMHNERELLTLRFLHGYNLLRACKATETDRQIGKEICTDFLVSPYAKLMTELVKSEDA